MARQTILYGVINLSDIPKKSLLIVVYEVGFVVAEYFAYKIKSIMIANLR